MPKKSSKTSSVAIAAIDEVSVAAQFEIEELICIGDEFITKESREIKLQALSDDELLTLMLHIISQTSVFENPSTLLGLIGACSYELISRKSHYVGDNTGIPWRAFTYLHRVLSDYTRGIKLLPISSFTEGIYYDEELNQEARQLIIANDLPELAIVLHSILYNKFNQQRFPIANYSTRIYNFYYNECHLQFLRYACRGMLKSHIYDTILPKPPDAAIDLLYNKIAIQNYFLYCINIGEAFTSLSAELTSLFGRDLVKSFKDARNLLVHPERPDNKDKIDALLSGTMTIYNLLNIDKEHFQAKIEEIADIAVQILQTEYKYIFDVNFHELEYVPKPAGDSGQEYNPFDCSKQFQRVISAIENMSGNNESLNILNFAFNLRPKNEILKTATVIAAFSKTVISYVNSGKDINYQDCIAFLKGNYAEIQRIKAKIEQDRAPDEEQFYKDYNGVWKETIKKLTNANWALKDIKYQLRFLQLFLEEYNLTQDEALCKNFDDIKKQLNVNFEKLKPTILDEDQLKYIVFLIDFYVNIFKNDKKSKLKSINSLKYSCAGRVEEIQAVRARLENSDTDEAEGDAFFSFQHKEQENDGEKSTPIDESKVKDVKLALILIKEIAKFHHEFTILYQFYERISNDSDDERKQFISQYSKDFFGPVAWYYNILLGSLSRRLLDIDLIKQPELGEFTKFFKDNFQMPRGDLAHNQVALIGDEEYLEAIKVQQEGRRRGELLLQWSQVRSLSDLTSNEKGELVIECTPWKAFPAAGLKIGAVMNNEEVMPVYKWLTFLARIDHKVYLNYVITRSSSGKITIDGYFLDNPCDDFDNLSSAAFLALCYETDNPHFDNNTLIDETLQKTGVMSELIKETLKTLDGFCCCIIDFGPILIDDQLAPRIKQEQAMEHFIRVQKLNTRLWQKYNGMEVHAISRINERLREDNPYHLALVPYKPH